MSKQKVGLLGVFIFVLGGFQGGLSAAAEKKMTASQKRFAGLKRQEAEAARARAEGARARAEGAAAERPGRSGRLAAGAADRGTTDVSVAPLLPVAGQENLTLAQRAQAIENRNLLKAEVKKLKDEFADKRARLMNMEKFADINLEEDEEAEGKEAAGYKNDIIEIAYALLDRLDKKAKDLGVSDDVRYEHLRELRESLKQSRRFRDYLGAVENELLERIAAKRAFLSEKNVTLRQVRTLLAELLEEQAAEPILAQFYVRDIGVVRQKLAELMNEEELVEKEKRLEVKEPKSREARFEASKEAYELRRAEKLD
ncbi:MAG: hypothetical protein NT124_01800 [Candidatus Dependentiae bacterium]|nr:hypothetical protein [Candidatus Dependentiae bacterium]